MAQLLAEIAKYDSDLAEQIRANRQPSDSKTQLLIECIEQLHRRFIDFTNTRDHYNPLMRRLVSPSFSWHSNDSGILDISTSTYEEFAENLKTLWSGKDTKDVQLGIVDLCTEIEYAGTSRARAWSWMTIRVHGPGGHDFLNGVRKDLVGKAKWERSAEAGWIWTSFETMRGLQFDGAPANF
jgi:hypothetical protein